MYSSHAYEGSYVTKVLNLVKGSYVTKVLNLGKSSFIVSNLGAHLGHVFFNFHVVAAIIHL